MSQMIRELKVSEKCKQAEKELQSAIVKSKMKGQDPKLLLRSEEAVYS
jgi:hypothetical protein